MPTFTTKAAHCVALRTQHVGACGVIAAVALANPARAEAQGNSDAAHCAVAAAILARGVPAHKVADARYDLAACPERGDAYAAAMRRLRGSSDTAALTPFYNVAFALVDAGTANAAVDVAKDVGASAEARALAFRVLTLYAGKGYSFELPTVWQATSASLANGCFPRSVAGLPRLVDRPLPSEWASQAISVASAVYADVGNPLPVRASAACLQEALVESRLVAAADPASLRTGSAPTATTARAGVTPRTRPTGPSRRRAGPR